MSNSLRPHELQDARLPCPSPSPGICSDLCPLSQWCYLAISSSDLLGKFKWAMRRRREGGKDGKVGNGKGVHFKRKISWKLAFWRHIPELEETEAETSRWKFLTQTWVPNKGLWRMVLKVGQPEYLLWKEGWAAQDTEEAISDDMTLWVYFSVSGKFKGKHSGVMVQGTRKQRAHEFTLAPDSSMPCYQTSFICPMHSKPNTDAEVCRETVYSQGNQVRRRENKFQISLSESEELGIFIDKEVVIKQAECWGIDAFELWCWRRLLRAAWTARRSNQSILKEINPEYSSEGLMLKLKLQLILTPDMEMTHWKRPWCWEKLKAKEEGNRKWDG